MTTSWARSRSSVNTGRHNKPLQPIAREDALRLNGGVGLQLRDRRMNPERSPWSRTRQSSRRELMVSVPLISVCSRASRLPSLVGAAFSSYSLCWRSRVASLRAWLRLSSFRSVPLRVASSLRPAGALLFNRPHRGSFEFYSHQ
jgi:hypothetical protein